MPASAECKRAASAWRAGGGKTFPFDGALPEAELYVDALFGIGLSRPVTGAAQAMIERINASRRPVLALGRALRPRRRPRSRRAHLRRSRGDAVLRRRQARPAHRAGLRPRRRRAIDGLACPASLLELAPPRAVSQRHCGWLAPRHANAHKGEHGHVLCVGGESGMGGAVRLCAEAALRTARGWPAWPRAAKRGRAGVGAARGDDARGEDARAARADRARRRARGRPGLGGRLGTRLFAPR
jgi:NAD(P)H-hydrate epimerase